LLSIMLVMRWCKSFVKWVVECGIFYGGCTWKWWSLARIYECRWVGYAIYGHL